MAEPYSDEEWYALEVPSLDERIWKTLFRLQRERDEARRVAVSLGDMLEHKVPELTALIDALRDPETES